MQLSEGQVQCQAEVKRAYEAVQKRKQPPGLHGTMELWNYNCGTDIIFETILRLLKISLSFEQKLKDETIELCILILVELQKR